MITHEEFMATLPIERQEAIRREAAIEIAKIDKRERRRAFWRKLFFFWR